MRFTARAGHARLNSWLSNLSVPGAKHVKGHRRSCRNCGVSAPEPASHFSNEVSHQLSVLQGQFAGLGDTWRDQEHEKFANNFSETVQVLTRFMESAQQHIPFLLRKAERIDEYLQQR